VTSLNWLDYSILAILLISTLLSARRGFSREAIGLASAVAAFILGMWFYGLAGSYVARLVSSESTANLIGFLLVVFGVLICGILLGRIVSRFLRGVGLSFFDRLLGAAFGFARGLLVVMAVLTAFTAFGPFVASDTAPAAMVHSRFAPYVLEASRWFVAAAPMELKSGFRTEYARVMDELRDRSN
jgi:membrane protein required for colicin V production